MESLTKRRHSQDDYPLYHKCIHRFFLCFLFSHVSTIIHLSIHLAGLLNKMIRGLVGG